VSSTRPVWQLEHFDGELRRVVRIPVDVFPFRVGRRHGLELPLISPQISSLHAQIEKVEDHLELRDLGSTNGTFRNRERVEDPVVLEEGDILHFASLEFRLRHHRPGIDVGTRTESIETSLISINLQSLIQETEALSRLLELGEVRTVYQPILDLASGSLAAYEALGRGTDEALPESPAGLFAIADAAGSVAPLSRLFRADAVRTAHAHRLATPLFVNAHSADLEQGDLLDELAGLQALAPGLRLVLEVSEQYGGGIEPLRELRAGLHARGIALAYDDFGAGLARISELAEAPADYLKFDAALIRDVDRASQAKRRLLSTLVEAARDLGMAPLAEGIETKAEHAACRDLGFELAQGFLLGRPGPLASEPE